MKKANAKPSPMRVLGATDTDTVKIEPGAKQPASGRVISFPLSGNPKRHLGNIEKEQRSISRVNPSDTDFKSMIAQHQSGLLSKNSLYRKLRELWGLENFEGTLSCHENMKTRCKADYAILDPEFESFPDFVFHMGPRLDSSLSIDRINNSLGYSPENCRWADKVTQTRNRANTVFLTDGGETKPLAEWAELTGISAKEMYKRRSEGLSHHEVIYGRGSVLLPSSDHWPPRSWVELEVCVETCGRWSNQDRQTLKELIKSRIEWINREAWLMSTILTARRQLSWPVEAGNDLNWLLC